MPRAKAPSPGIGRPLSELRADVGRVDSKVDALIEATARLADATAALLAHAVASPLTAAPSALQAALVPPMSVGIGAAAVPRGTNGHAIYEGDPIVAPTRGAIGLSGGTPIAAMDEGELTDDQDQSHDLNATLAAELASFAQEDEEIPSPPTDDDMFDQWARRYDMFRQQKMWLEGWGPRPGQEGCLVPPEMMRQGRR